MITSIVAAAVVILLVVATSVRRRGRARTLGRIRAAWGQPVARARQLDAAAASHRSRISHLDEARSLDDRTWRDLDLDDVFAALDRTESTLGQHALFHRLRTSPVGDDLEEFELLVSRFEKDTQLREPAQMALSRLQDPHGYNLWWLGTPNAVATRSW